MKTYVNVIVDEETKRKAVFILKAKGKTLTDMVNEQLEKYAKEFEKNNS
jgi:antitoxin component of RelBE/YafQ-DinJ toxin-antitoxin module